MNLRKPADESKHIPLLRNCGGPFQKPSRTQTNKIWGFLLHRKQAYDAAVSSERVTLRRQVRAYFAEIGRRGGEAGRRDLTRQPARLMLEIREAKRAAKKNGRAPPKLSRKDQQILRGPH